jgi:hypothetical protein
MAEVADVGRDAVVAEAVAAAPVAEGAVVAADHREARTQVRNRLAENQRGPADRRASLVHRLV